MAGSIAATWITSSIPIVAPVALQPQRPGLPASLPAGCRNIRSCPEPRGDPRPEDASRTPRSGRPSPSPALGQRAMVMPAAVEKEFRTRWHTVIGDRERRQIGYAQRRRSIVKHLTPRQRIQTGQHARSVTACHADAGTEMPPTNLTTRPAPPPGHRPVGRAGIRGGRA